MNTLKLGIDITRTSSSDIIQSFFLKEVFLHKHAMEFQCASATPLEEIESFLESSGMQLAATYHREGFFNVWHGQKTAVLVNYYQYNFSIFLCADSRDKLGFLKKALINLLPPLSVDDMHISLKLWYLSPNGTGSRTRRIGVPLFSVIDENYNVETKTGLHQLAQCTRPTDRGKLILFHGSPGTGKTWAIRALLKEWSDWCTAEYITDPEKFFGDAHYMLSVLMDDSESSFKVEHEEKWRLLVIEDADEFLNIDAKQLKGQALSRLLNHADGMLGQGLNILMLLTTNEPVEKLHPAVSRERRCMANIRFNELSTSEAKNWCEMRGISHTVSSPMTLAQLYAVSGGGKIQTVTETRTIGFGKNGH